MMKTDRNILIAFILNMSFSIFELVGGALTGSVAIISDAVHDLGDALSIGISYFLEKKSRKHADDIYTFGYSRYSVIGSVITTLILLFGSVMVIYNAVLRIFHPTEIHYDGMIIFAVFGVIMNFSAAWITKDGHSINQKAVNLHMLEDVLGWAVVLLGAVVMRFTDISILDPMMSICVAIYILFHAIHNLKEVLDLFLEKVPTNISVEYIKENLLLIEGIKEIHHIHVWSMDGVNHLASMHVVADGDICAIKKEIRTKLKFNKINHVTLEFEEIGTECEHKDCNIEFGSSSHHHHHHEDEHDHHDEKCSDHGKDEHPHVHFKENMCCS